MEGMMIKGVAKDTNVSSIAVLGVHDQPGIAFKVFSLLAQRKINVDLILQSVGRDGTKALGDVTHFYRGGPLFNHVAASVSNGLNADEKGGIARSGRSPFHRPLI